MICQNKILKLVKCLKSNVIGKYCRSFEDVVYWFLPLRPSGCVTLFSFALLRGMRLCNVRCAVLC